MRAFMPDRLDGKLNSDQHGHCPRYRGSAGARRPARLVTSTPDFGGRSFGTNVVEAALVAFLGKHLEAVGAGAYSEAIARLHLRPRLVELNAAA